MTSNPLMMSDGQFHELLTDRPAGSPAPVPPAAAGADPKGEPTTDHPQAVGHAARPVVGMFDPTPADEMIAAARASWWW